MAVTMTPGTAAGMVAGTAVGMIRGFTALPAIGVTARPGASAGDGAVSMPASTARLGAGVATGDPVIGAVVTGLVPGDTIIITILPTIIAVTEDVPLMQAVIEDRATEETVPLIEVLPAVVIMDLLLR